MFTRLKKLTDRLVIGRTIKQDVEDFKSGVDVNEIRARHGFGPLTGSDYEAAVTMQEEMQTRKRNMQRLLKNN